MRIPDEVLQEIRDRISILDVVGRHVALKRSGKNWKGLCPFHAEKTPSFVVNEERGSYHCFGCGAGGTAFRFLMELEGRTFTEAVEELANKAGVALRTGPVDPAVRQRQQRRGQVLEVLDLAARYYRYQLTDGRAGAAAREYLARREVSAEAAEQFFLGCAPAGWDHLTRYLAGKGVDSGLAEEAGLISERRSGGYYDRLRERLVFPIHDPTGRVVSFGGRMLGDGEPKYLNGPESPVFHKSAVLYGLHQGSEALRRERRALIVEGYLDVISLHARGVANAVAPLGTAVTSEHVQMLRRRVDEAVMLFDGDDAGRKAAFRSLDVFLAEGFAARGAMLPPEHDPDSFVRAGGDLTPLVSGAPPLMELFLEEVAATARAGVDGTVAAVDQALPRLAAISDPVARDLYYRRAAEILGVTESLLRQRAVPGHRARQADQTRPVAPARRKADPVEKALLRCLVAHPALRERFLAEGGPQYLSDGPGAAAIGYLLGCAHAAAALPVEEAPEAARHELTEALVAADLGPEAYAGLVARLQLRALETEARQLDRELAAAERRGDAAAVSGWLRRKMEMDQRCKQIQQVVASRGRRVLPP